MPRGESQRRYDAENLKKIVFSINKKTESDLVAHLQDMSNRATYIKRLIREDMERQGVRPSSGTSSLPERRFDHV